MQRSPVRVPVALALAVLLTAGLPLPAQQAPPEAPPEAPPAPPVSATSEGRGSLEGRVLAHDGKTPVSAAVVRVSHLRTAQTLASSPTDAHGAFALTQIPYGYLDLVVETPEGGYVASKVVNLGPEGHVSVTLVLTKNEDMPQGWWAGRQPRTLPGTETPAVGVAEVREAGRSWFRGKKGIALLAGAGALALLALSGSSNDSPASPSSP